MYVVMLFDENLTGKRCQVESLSAAVRQLELERNEVQSQLYESQALCQALRDKLENIQHDLASQGLQSVCLGVTRRLVTQQREQTSAVINHHETFMKPSLTRKRSAPNHTVLAESAFSLSSPAIWNSGIPFLFLSPHSLPCPLSNLSHLSLQWLNKECTDIVYYVGVFDFRAFWSSAASILLHVIFSYTLLTICNSE